MSIIDTFSKRKKRERGEAQEVYQYDNFPNGFRVQVIHIWTDVLGKYHHNYDVYSGEPRSNKMWENIHNALARERGVFRLHEGNDPFAICTSYLLNEQNAENLLDLIEITFKVIHSFEEYEEYELDNMGLKQMPKNAIKELNYRFKEHGIGYQFINNEIIRIDSEYAHEEIIKPALKLLHDAKFKGAEEEFLKAHEHYRHGRTKEAIVDALKSFESTMRTICDLQKWVYPPKATAQGLIGVIFDKGLLPLDLQNHFTSLRALLEGGLPTVRNTKSAHGQGPTPVIVPEHFVRYALNLAGANIIFLIESYQAKTK